MKGERNDMPKILLRSTLGYLEREAKRRADSGAAQALRFTNAELAALLDVLRREVETASSVDTSARAS